MKFLFIPFLFLAQIGFGQMEIWQVKNIESIELSLPDADDLLIVKDENGEYRAILETQGRAQEIEDFTIEGDELQIDGGEFNIILIEKGNGNMSGTIGSQEGNLERVTFKLRSRLYCKVHKKSCYKYLREDCEHNPDECDWIYKK